MTIRLLRKLRVFHWVDLSMMDLYAYIGQEKDFVAANPFGGAAAANPFGGAVAPAAAANPFGGGGFEGGFVFGAPF